MRRAFAAGLVGSLVVAGACDSPETVQLKERVNYCYSLDFLQSGQKYFDCLKALPVQKRSKLCTISLNGSKLFLGVNECYPTLPQEEIRGYWIHGFELSQFFPSLDLLRSNESGTLLQLSAGARTYVESLRLGHEPRILEVTFVGVISTAPGMYYLDADQGVYASRFISAIDISDRVWGAH